MENIGKFIFTNKNYDHKIDNMTSKRCIFCLCRGNISSRFFNLCHIFASVPYYWITCRKLFFHNSKYETAVLAISLLFIIFLDRYAIAWIVKSWPKIAWIYMFLDFSETQKIGGADSNFGNFENCPHFFILLFFYHFIYLFFL